MRRHTQIGERIVLAAPALANTGPLIRSSHERIDGHGYPDGLAGDDIPLGSRIIAVCDAYHAMTADRAYRPGIGIDAALQELRRHAGTQFDTTVVEAFCKLKPRQYRNGAPRPSTVSR
jgi:two-component system, cell cycle response regulator